MVVFIYPIFDFLFLLLLIMGTLDKLVVTKRFKGQHHFSEGGSKTQVLQLLV